MTDYRIKATGSSFVIAADGQDILRCSDGNVARQIVRDAEADRFRQLLRQIRQRLDC
jgi:hypothetical protein